MKTKSIVLIMAVMLALSSITAAQIRTGVIDGKVTDEQGAVMPGVIVTLTGEKVIGASNAVTVEDGTYRFRGLEPGTYNLGFELAGFATFNREGILIAGARTITVNVTMAVAAVAETITVTGESPLIDVKQTVIGANFDEVKQEIPGATDTWALLGQTPGVRMRGFDVGGSHKSQQSGYEAYGVRGQSQVSVDGLITTESTGGTTWYFDYYATEEVRISASSGADAEMETAGAAYVTTIKSGGDNFSSLVNFDITKEGMVGSNLDEATIAQGYTGNQTLDFWEFHGDIGGPIMKERAWFYFAHNRFRIDTSISGQDPDVATDLARIYQFNFKATWQFTEKDKLVYFMLRNDKDKPQRYLSATRPLESTAHNINPGYGYKAEWQRVWSDKLYTSILFGYMDDDWWNVPNVDPVERPPREDFATGFVSGAYMYPFVTLWRDPSIVANSNYYVSEAAGSHDIKIGGMWRYENHFDAESAQAGPVYYFDEDGAPLELELADYPNNIEKDQLTSNKNRRWGFWIQDNWTPSERLTLNLGVRFLSQHAFYGSANNKNDQALFAPEWYPWLEGLFPTAPVPGADVGTWSALAPRLGATYDLTGEGRTVLKASYGRYYNNFSYGLASSANPGYSNGAGFEWQDLDGNNILTRAEAIGRQELGEMIYDWGGGSTEIDTSAPLPYSDQFQVSLEHQFRGESAMRIMYVHKTRDRLGLGGSTWNLAQAPFLSVPFQAEDPGAPGQMLNLLTTPADQFGSNNVMTEYPNSNHWKYDTITVGLERRLSKNFFAQGSFDYQWRSEARNTGHSTSPFTADPISTGWYQNHSADVDTIQKSTNWGFKALARYQLPYEIGLATNIRVQNGWPYARRVDITIFAGTGVESPVAESLGSKAVFVEDIKNNRSDSVPLWDFRIDKTFSLGNAGNFMIMADIYNILNSNAVTNFNIRTGSYGDVIAALPPRTLKIGLRWTY